MSLFLREIACSLIRRCIYSLRYSCWLNSPSVIYQFLPRYERSVAREWVNNNGAVPDGLTAKLNLRALFTVISVVVFSLIIWPRFFQSEYTGPKCYYCDDYSDSVDTAESSMNSEVAARLTDSASEFDAAVSSADDSNVAADLSDLVSGLSPSDSVPLCYVH